MVQDVVERFLQLLTGKENSVALIVGGVCMWGDASIKRVANTGIESEQVEDRGMHKKLVKQEVAIR